jgi:uncharacterized membrane protein YdjX (TVP38/TMEM64 family)
MRIGWGDVIRLSYVTLLLTILILSAIFYSDVKNWSLIFLNEVEKLGWWGNLIVVGLYIGVSLFAVAGAPAVLSFFCGMAYGYWLGVITAEVGMFLSTNICFFAGRTILRSTVERFIQKKGKLAVLDQMVKDRGFPTVFMIRMAIFPPSLMNYFLSITSVSFLAYFWGTILGMVRIVSSSS